MTSTLTEAKLSDDYDTGAGSASVKPYSDWR